MDVTDFLQLFFYGEAIPILLSVTWISQKARLSCFISFHAEAVYLFVIYKTVMKI